MDGAMTQDVRVTNVYRGKNVQIAGVVLLFIGMFGCLGSVMTSDSSSASSGMMLLLVAVGLGLYIYGKAQHWYHAE